MTFLPLSLLIQFRNYFNIFFLITTIVLSIPIFSTLDPSKKLIQFGLILTIAIIREGYEDLVKFYSIKNKTKNKIR